MLDRLRQGGYWLVRGKINLIDRAFTSCRIESFADLGAVWGVEGAYTFRALDKYPVKEAVLVDGRITPTVAARANSYPQLRVIEGTSETRRLPIKSVMSTPSSYSMCCCTKCRLIGTLS